MKKALLLALALTIGVLAQAQIVTSSSSVIKYQKVEKKTTWYFKPGFSVMKMSYGEDLGDYLSMGARVGYNMDFGFQRTIRQKGAYWGMEFGLGSRGYSMKESYEYWGIKEEWEEKVMAHNIQISPFTFGWMVNLGCDGKLRLDPHVGVFISCDYAGKIKDEDGDSEQWLDGDVCVADFGLNIGVGIWYNRFNFDFTYQHGFIPVYNEGPNMYVNNVLFRIGVAF